jgi:hypothetical protein
MPKIEELFDESRDLHRVIEKVITFGVSQEERLKKEISEYIVTPYMEAEFEDLLTKMQLAMEHGGPNEVGVWLSGFYGSGKSSFAKYLGLALDDSIKVGGVPFLQCLQDRFTKTQTKQLLSKLAKSYPAAVVFLDLASDMLAGNTMAEISTVLFYKVLEYAGYSRNIKVAALERRLEKDGRLGEFKKIIQSELGVDWEMVQNDLLVVDSVIPELAHRFYPQLFKTSTSFTSSSSAVVQFETDRVQEMLEIVRKHSGKEYIVFVIDEVGQYVAPSNNLILNLDGLAKNLKNIGNGKVWIMATAQQTLTEDDPRAAINTPELFKLNDRFPIKIDLPASDIKKICYERLLKKSANGEAKLRRLFDEKGQELRHNTKLENAKYYSADFDADTFADLYPFLPSHFDILLQLLGALAKSTGGIGLRSAIKVIQDILIEGPENQLPACSQDVGWLTTLVTMFDALERDIERASRTVYGAFGKIGIAFPGSSLHTQIGKTVAILQILGNVPATKKNVAALMHGRVDGSSAADAIAKAIDELIADPKVPFDERDGSLCFLSERLSEIQRERAEIPSKSIEYRRIFSNALKNVFEPLPSAKLEGTLTVTSGLKQRLSGQDISLAGERNTIQTIVTLVPGEQFDSKVAEFDSESGIQSNRNNVYLVGKQIDQIETDILEIYRSEEIARRFRNDPDEDVRDYCNSQSDRAHQLLTKVETAIEKQLREGILIFRSDKTAVETYQLSLLEACKKHLATSVVDLVFDKYKQAPVRADTTLAEAFLKKENLNAITSQIDPMGLVTKSGGSFQINTGHEALTSISDYLDSQGSLDGKQLTQKFTEDPYAWSPDTLRYLIAALFRSGELKLKISGQEITALGQLAIEGLRNNNAFKKVIVTLRDVKPKAEDLVRAASRLTGLMGEQVIPLEDDICKAANRYISTVQSEFSMLSQKLVNLELPGSEELQSICVMMGDLLSSDASGAPTKIGAEDSVLFAGIVRATSVQEAFNHGIGETIGELRKVIAEIESLPATGVPGKLREDTAEQISHLRSRLSSNGFHQHAPEYSSGLTQLKSAIAAATSELVAKQNESIQSAQQSLQNQPEWKELTNEEQAETLGQLDSHKIQPEPTLKGLKSLVNNEYSLSHQSTEMRSRVAELGKKRSVERLKQLRDKNEKLSTTISLKKKLSSLADIDATVSSLHAVRQKAESHPEFEIRIELDD